MNDDFKESKLISIAKTSVYLFSPLLIISLPIIYFAFFYDGQISQESFAQFGDYFGGILNPLLSFLAILLLLLSIRLQSKELSATRNELKETKEIHNENIRSQENLFALQVITTEVKEISIRVSEAVNLISESNYELSSGERVHLNPANALGLGDTDKIILMEYDYLHCFIAEYSYVMANLTNCMQCINGYLDFAEKKQLVVELMPMNSMRKTFATCVSVKSKSKKVLEVLSDISMCEDMESSYRQLEGDIHSLGVLLKAINSKLLKK